MLGLVKEISGQKTIVPLTTDTGTGAPVGSFIYMYKKSSPSGYLYCDGSTFDETAYPALYLYLGSNVLPDYRECVMVGAEQNTTDTIAEHDVYTQGEFKDDQLQTHRHGAVQVNGLVSLGAVGDPSWSESALYSTTLSGASNNTISLSAGTNTGRSGTTTHGKQKAVYVYIKATSGLAENQQENVLNATKDYVDNSNSYSTDETLTGGKWIDGKPIYRKTIIVDSNIRNYMSIANIPIDTLVNVSGMFLAAPGDYKFTVPWVNATLDESLCVYYISSESNLYIVYSKVEPTKIVVNVDYTKTTD